MKKYNFIIVPIIYILLLCGFIFLQYSGQLTLRKTIDTIRFTGRIARGFDESSPYITSANVSIAGLHFLFSSRNPLVLYTPDSSVELLVQSYEIEEQSLTLFFENAASLRFAAKSETAIDIVIAIPTELVEYGNIQITVDRDAALSPSTNQEIPEIINFSTAEKNYSLVLPPFSEYVEQNKYLTVGIASEETTLRFSEETESLMFVSHSSILEQLPEIDESDYMAQIESYIDDAYQGWSTTRLNGASGTWEQFTQAPVFSETIVVSALSEAWRRANSTGDTAYNELATRMRSIVQLHQSELSIDSMAFLGGMRDILPRALLAQQNRVSTLQQRISAQDIRIIEQFDLIPFVSFVGDSALNSRLENFFQFLDLNELPTEYIIYLFELYTLRDTFPTSATSWLLPFEETGELFLVPKIIQVNDAIFLETGVNEVNTALSLRAGLAFVRYGKETKQFSIENLGRNLVSAVLELRDSNNTIPEYLYLGIRNAELSQSYFNPERIFRFLRIDAPWPHFTAVNTPESGKTTWAWSLVSIADSYYVDNELRITVSAPIDRSSYIAVANIEPFNSMTLFGLDWRNDPNFELYARGRYYDSESKSLMIKHNDSVVRRTITLRYTGE